MQIKLSTEVENRSEILMVWQKQIAPKEESLSEQLLSSMHTELLSPIRKGWNGKLSAKEEKS